MGLDRTRRRLRILRMGVSTLATIYGQERSLRRVAGNVWFVATRQGLIGVRHWLIHARIAADTALVAPEPTTLKAAAPEPEPPPPDPAQLYADWRDRFDPLGERDTRDAQRHLASLDLPTLAIVAVMAPGQPFPAARMVAAWQASLHPCWRATIVVQPEIPAAALDAVRDAVAAEPRVALATTPAAVAAAWVPGGHTLLCFGGVLPGPLAPYMFLEAAMRTGAELVYADHDLVDADGVRSSPEFKPQFSPEYLARFNYLGDCVLLSGAVALDASVLPHLTLAGFDRLVARLAAGRRVAHVPFTLFHVTHAQPRVAHDLPVFPDGGPGVTIVIPTRDGLAHLRPCIESILKRTSYDLDRVEVVVMDNNSVEPETLAFLDELGAQPRMTVLPYRGAFNFADINNAGARASSGDVLVFLNNDTVVHDPAWLSKLVGHASRPGVGAVGAKLLFPDGTVQHGGCVAGGTRGTVQHLLGHVAAVDAATADHTREMSVMTGACLAMRREVFDRVGGFDPVLRITWNDAKLCLACLEAGLRNIYVADPLLVHDESRTRPVDNTRAHYVRFFSEADYTRRRFRGYFQDDPSFNPNRSVERSAERATDLADPPRVRRPWARLPGRPARILVLSAVYRMGFGVAVVIQQQVRTLVARGHDVVIGGPLGANELAFPGCARAVLGSVKEAAAYAFTHDVALVIAHTPPFFELPLLIGGEIPVLAYDYGEPPAEFFPDPVRSYLLNVGYQKREAAALTTVVATISQAVKDETLHKDALVLGLANSHLPAWDEALRPDRERMRRAQGWGDGFVVLTVCRFHENERAYKGLDKVSAILREFPYLYPDASRGVVWALAGAGTPEDVGQVEQLGFTVFPNVSDATLADLYKAADAYMGLSRWEGYNLGISQALAMGLPTLGSDIPAHREFPITTTDSILAACAWLAEEVARGTAGTETRRATVYGWDRSTAAFAEVAERMLGDSAAPARRLGASGQVWEDVGTQNELG